MPSNRKSSTSPPTKTSKPPTRYITETQYNLLRYFACVPGHKKRKRCGPCGNAVGRADASVVVVETKQQRKGRRAREKRLEALKLLMDNDAEIHKNSGKAEFGCHKDHHVASLQYREKSKKRATQLDHLCQGKNMEKGEREKGDMRRFQVRLDSERPRGEPGRKYGPNGRHTTFATRVSSHSGDSSDACLQDKPRRFLTRPLNNVEGVFSVSDEDSSLLGSTCRSILQETPGTCNDNRRVRIISEPDVINTSQRLRKIPPSSRNTSCIGLGRRGILKSRAPSSCKTNLARCTHTDHQSSPSWLDNPRNADTDTVRERLRSPIHRPGRNPAERPKTPAAVRVPTGEILPRQQNFAPQRLRKGDARLSHRRNERKPLWERDHDELGDLKCLNDAPSHEDEGYISNEFPLSKDSDCLECKRLKLKEEGKHHVPDDKLVDFVHDVEVVRKSDEWHNRMWHWLLHRS